MHMECVMQNGGKLMLKGGKKLLAVMLCLAFACSAFACGGGGKGGKTIDETYTTAIYVAAGGGGTGKDWMTNALKRFQEKVKDKEYAPGKKGIAFDVDDYGGTHTLANYKTDGIMIMSVDRADTLESEAAKGSVVCIDDIMRETETETRNGQPISVHDKFLPEMRSWYQDGTGKADGSGKYYGVPYIEMYAGLSYNRDVFDSEGLFFASDTSGEQRFSQKFGKVAYFTNAAGSLSLGPDGKPNTQDDGLPSTLEEWLMLCDYMFSKGISPINLTGEHLNYVNFLQDGMLPALIGYDRYRDIVYNCDSKGEDVEVVVGVSTENLFPGISYIKKPITQKVKITPSCGYYASWMVEKYYVDAILEIIEHEGWFYPDANNQTSSHIDAQFNFLRGSTVTAPNQKVGMLIEASYWNYESMKDGNYALLGKNPDEVDVRWMPLPVKLFGSVTSEAEGADPFLYEFTSSYLCINGRYANDPEHLNACKDFLRFLMTDEELSHWTVSNYNWKPMTYEITETDKASMLPFYQDLEKIHASGRVLYNWEPASQIFIRNRGGYYARGWGSGQFGTGGQPSMIAAVRNGTSAQAAFAEQMYTVSNWQIIGGMTPTDYNGVVSSLKA